MCICVYIEFSCTVWTHDISEVLYDQSVILEKAYIAVLPHLIILYWPKQYVKTEV